jgi:hypothetical protein
MPRRRAVPTHASLALAAIAASCAPSPAFRPGAVTELRVVELPASAPRTIDDRAALDELSACLSRAHEVEQRSGDRWTHSLAPGGARDGLWRYDAVTGELQVLAKNLTPLYRLDEPDRARVERLLAPSAGPAR